MASGINFEFLRLEFKELYDEINETITSTSKEKVDKFDRVVEKIIFQIYKKNMILYDDKLDNIENIKILNNINLLPEAIMNKLIMLITDIRYNYLKPEELDEENDIKIWINKNKKNIFEVLIWFVVKCGEENYSLLSDSAEQWEQDILSKYINSNELVDSQEEANDDISIEESKLKASKLVEIGENYYFGRGVKKSNREALKYFLKAAQLKDEYAEAYIGMFYEKGIAVKRDYNLARKWYSLSAIKGNSYAQYSLGVLILNGNGVKKEYDKALIWFQKSAESEYVPAYYQLGRMFYNGLGVDINYDYAFKWYSKAADKNLGAAQHALSFMYKNGEGCEKNVNKAYYWIELAAENEYEDAYYIVGKSYLDGINVEVNYEKAFNYLTKGYEELDTNCIEALADMYLQGLYVKKDIFHALELYNKSIDYGNNKLYFKVGKIYEEQGLTKQAISYYNRGHEDGDIKSTQRLGVMYYNGEGVSRDLEKAIKYMEVAAKNKAPHAMYVLGVAYLRLNKFGEETSKISRKLLEEAYYLKSPYAAEYLAYIMLNEKREGKEIDENKLIEYIEFGVKNNLQDSMFQYGYIYDKGIAVKVDLEKSYYYYCLAAENKSVKAIGKLGDWFKRGKFVSQDIDIAIRWYEMAAKQKDIEAIEKLIEIYEFGIGNRKNDMKALYYVFKLIDLDALRGKKKLAYYCFTGRGVEQDNEKGNELIKEIQDIDKGSGDNLRAFLGENKIINMTQDEIINTYMEGIENGNLECYGDLALYLYKNNLYNKEKYKEKFITAMEGKELGLKKCLYVYLKQLLEEKEKNAIVTVEEILIIKQLQKVADKGLFFIYNDIADWYKNRKKEDEESYLTVKKQVLFYNVEIEKTKKSILNIMLSLTILTIITLVGISVIK